MMTRPWVAALTAATAPTMGLAIALFAPSAGPRPPAAQPGVADRPRPMPQTATGTCAWVAGTTTLLRSAPKISAPAVKSLEKGQARPCVSTKTIKGGRYRACGGRGDRWVRTYWGASGPPTERTAYLAARCVTLWKG